MQSLASQPQPPLRMCILPNAVQSCQATNPPVAPPSSDTLLHLAEYLAPADRLLMRWIHAEGKTCAQAATLARSHERTVQRRARRLLARLNAPEFAFAARQLERAAWDKPTRTIARECILLGRTVRDVAAELRTTQHAVRARRAAIIAMARGAACSQRIAAWRSAASEAPVTGRQDPT